MNPFSTKTRIIAMDNMYIQNSVGTDRITYTNGQSYYNLSTLWGLTDYFDVKDHYSFVKLNSVSFEITRVADEATIRDSCNGSIWLHYAPDLSNTVETAANLKRNQSSYEIDLMTFDKQLIVCPFSNIQLESQTGIIVGDFITINNHVPMVTNLVKYIQGQLSLASDNTRTGAESKRLFSIVVRFNIDMYYRD
jgi:hypothetical protein